MRLQKLRKVLKKVAKAHLGEKIRRLLRLVLVKKIRRFLRLILEEKLFYIFCPTDSTQFLFIHFSLLIHLLLFIYFFIPNLTLSEALSARSSEIIFQLRVCWAETIKEPKFDLLGQKGCKVFFS